MRNNLLKILYHRLNIKSSVVPIKNRQLSRLCYGREIIKYEVDTFLLVYESMIFLKTSMSIEKSYNYPSHDRHSVLSIFDLVLLDMAEVLLL